MKVPRAPGLFVVLCARSLLGPLCWMICVLCSTKRSHRKSVTGLSCRGPIRFICAARWIGNRRHRCARRRHSKDTSHKRKQNLFTAYQMLELARILLCFRVISWQIGWLGTRVGESAVPGPGGTTQAHQALELTGIRVCALIVSRQIGLLETRVGEAAVPGLDGGGDGVPTTINSRKQRMKAVDRVAGKIPVKQNGESEHFPHFDEAWRHSASTFPFFSRGSHAPMTQGNLTELSARAVVEAMSPMVVQL